MTGSEHTPLRPVDALLTAELFAPLHAELMRLLRGLSTADWDRRTVAGEWRVRDVAAHLLDGDLRKLSMVRDGHVVAPSEAAREPADLVRFLNALNAEWVAAARRLSPRVLTELLAVTGPMVSELVGALPPHGPAMFAVAWAGEQSSENWFDIGREFTERWHHQMQIREATGAPPLLERRWLFPVLDLSLRALPPAYADVQAREGTAVVVHVTGEAGGTWSLVRGATTWRLHRGAPERPGTTVELDPDAAWRLLFNALPASRARTRATVRGDAALAEPLFRTRSVMV